MSEMMPTVNIQDYVPPLTRPEHQIEPLMKNLMEREQEFHRMNQEAVTAMQQMATVTMQRMKQPGAGAYLPGGM